MNNVRLRFFLPLILGGAVVINALIASVLSNLSTGTLLTWLLGLFLMALGVAARRIPPWISYAAAGVLTAVIVAVGSLFIGGSADTVTYHEDVLLVLGAGIQGDKPTESLQNRLDRAVLYSEQNPDALIIVSGGQGPQETVTEAYAMEQYLLSKGVRADKILKEEAATSTTENFRFSKTILDERLDGAYSLAFVTTDYHIPRSTLNATQNGFPDATHCHSNTPWYMVLPNGLRECAALGKYLILG